MPEFSGRSKARLLTCHPDLQRLFNEVIKRRDCTIIHGRRNQDEQDELFRTGFSKLEYPHSKHNKLPSHAVDAMPYFSMEPHVRWDDIESMYNFVGYVQGIGDQLGIKIRSGADWNENLDFDDQSFIDAAHFELVD